MCIYIYSIIFPYSLLTPRNQHCGYYTCCLEAISGSAEAILTCFYCESLGNIGSD